MYIVRDIMQCKPGKVREMVKRFKSLNDLAPKIGIKPCRILTDVTGAPFWTIVGEFEVDNVDGFFAMMEKAFTNEEAGRIMAGYHDMVQGGRREIYKVEG
jgi:hypothetical protein